MAKDAGSTVSTEHLYEGKGLWKESTFDANQAKETKSWIVLFLWW
jgi:hypothetical protein